MTLFIILLVSFSCFNHSSSFHQALVPTGYIRNGRRPLPLTLHIRPQVPDTNNIISEKTGVVDLKGNASPSNVKSWAGRFKAPVAVVGMCLGLGIIASSTACSASYEYLKIPSPAFMKEKLASIMIVFSHSGDKGIIAYTISFMIWTMTVGVTTPIETAAGMAFPLSKAIPLSATGKIGGALMQYSLTKYIFRSWAREKMENNAWMKKVDASFQSHPFRVALIWRFGPLPEFVKNICPALVPTLPTRFQILATIIHGLPFTLLWSFLGNEASSVARGGHSSLFLKQMVAVITWIGLVLSPTLFGSWIKELDKEKTSLRGPDS